MFGVRVLTSKEVHKSFKDSMLTERFMSDLRKQVKIELAAVGQEVAIVGIEVLWFTWEETLNAAAVNVELQFSRRDDCMNLTEGQLQEVCDKLTAWLVSYRRYPNFVGDGSIWVKPINDAVYAYERIPS